MAGEIPFNQAFENIKKNADALGSLIPEPLSMEKSERERRGIVKTPDGLPYVSGDGFEGDVAPSLFNPYAQPYTAYFNREANRIVNLIDRKSGRTVGQNFTQELSKLLVFGADVYNLGVIKQRLGYYYPGTRYRSFPIEDSLVLTLIDQGNNAVMWEQYQAPRQSSYVNRFWVFEGTNPNALTVLQGQGLDPTTRTDLPTKSNLGPIYNGQKVSRIVPPGFWLVTPLYGSNPFKRYYSVMFETANKIDPGQAFDIATAFVKAIKGESVAPKPQPPVAGTIDGQKATESEVFKFTIPSGTFTDPDGDDNKLDFKATLDDGSPLPSWLTFNPKTQTFSGTPGHKDGRTLKIKVSASDAQGTASTTFDLTVETLEVSFIVDIDPTQNHNSDTAVSGKSLARLKNLPAGEYKVEVIGTAQGGQFDAWSRKCNCKWDTYYSRRLGSSGPKKIGNPNKYNSKAEALANRVPSTSFTLTDDTDVKFYTYSTSAADNIGGVSMRVEGNGIEQSVDLDATQNVNKEHAEICSLPAGDYTVTLLGTTEGGKYDAWSSTCSKKWRHAYKIRGDAKVTVAETGVYGNAGEAFAHRPAAETFRLKAPGEVKFYTYSASPDNDCGGVSLNVTRIGS